MSTVVAYKFLATGGAGPISGVQWPLPVRAGEPGAWLGSEGPVLMCKSGIHACTTQELAYWLHEELWRVELDGALEAGLDCVMAPRGRLLEKVSAWSNGGAQRFAAAVRDHAAAAIAARGVEIEARLTGYVEDSSWHVRHGALESPALAALCAAVAVAKIAAPAEEEAAYRRERAWQSHYIATEMELV